MNSMNKILLLFFLGINSFSQIKSSVDIKKRQDSIVEKYLTNCAENYNYNYQMAEWQQCLDEGLKKDSTVARLWQEKAMPNFKAKKYEVGMEFVNKAVFYDRKEFLPYRAFIKCIFSKEYKASILDFENAKNEFGNNSIMDHTYNFYIALCYLQLNEFDKAAVILQEDIDVVYKKLGEEWINTTDLFYLGIAKYELKMYAEAIIIFDRALKIYLNFSDAKYYKAICLARIKGSEETIKKLISEAKEDAKVGYTIGEYNTVYETYPYQKKWSN